MTMDITLMAFIACSVSIHSVSALSDNDTRVYLWAFMNITTDDSGLEHYQQVQISASIPSDFRLEIPFTGVDEYSFLSPGSKISPQWQERTYVVDLSMDFHKETAFNAIRITANNKIDIQASKVTKGSSDGFLILPLTADSTEFYIPSYNPIPQGHSSFLVVSPYKDTCIEASIINGTDVRRIFFRSLREFEVYQAYSIIDDYTGVHIKTTKPVAVFGGHECAQIPIGKQFCDHVIEQVPPVTEWGTDFIVGPIIGRAYQAGYIIRVVTGFSDTMITCTDASGTTLDVPETLDRGDFKEFTVTDNRLSIHCTCSERCLTVQYNTGYQAFDPNQDVNTDPWMTTITPQDHLTNYMTFSTMNFWADFKTKPFTSYMTIVARTAAKSGIRLNNNPLDNTLTWTDDIAATGYSSVAMRLVHGNYSLYHLDATEKFVAYVYGHSVETNPAGYGYATGYDIKGPPLPETTWDELLQTTQAPPSYTCTTARTMPAVNDRGPYVTYTLSASLVNQALTADCVQKYKVVLANKISQMKELVNRLICVGVLCPNTTHTFLTKLEISQYTPRSSLSIMDSFTVDIEAATSLDERTGELVRCKHTVIAFLQQSYNWYMPIDVLGCAPLDLKDVMLDLDQYKCNV